MGFLLDLIKMTVWTLLQSRAAVQPTTDLCTRLYKGFSIYQGRHRSNLVESPAGEPRTAKDLKLPGLSKVPSANNSVH